LKCEPGYHFVKEHLRVGNSGKRHIVSAHCRKNSKSKKKFLYKSNLDYLYQKLKGRYKYKRLNKIKGYPQDKGQYDDLIQFWLNYWKEQGLINEDIDPLLVKAIIAVESSFRERVITKMPGSSATGLMQLLVTTMEILAQKRGKEIGRAMIEISQEEAREANVNVAAGTRWLIYKITTSPKKKSKSKRVRAYSGVKFYHSWSEDGEDYANKVFKVYDESKK